jgi:hypothetical protein
LAASELLQPFQPADLSIVTFFPRSAASVGEVDRAAGALLDAVMYGDQPAFPSVLRVQAHELLARHPRLRRDADSARINRTVLMKPENEDYVEALLQILERAARPSGARTRRTPTAPPITAAR